MSGVAHAPWKTPPYCSKSESESAADSKDTQVKRSRSEPRDHGSVIGIASVSPLSVMFPLSHRLTGGCLPSSSCDLKRPGAYVTSNPVSQNKPTGRRHSLNSAPTDPRTRMTFRHRTSHPICQSSTATVVFALVDTPGGSEILKKIVNRSWTADVTFD